MRLMRAMRGFGGFIAQKPVQGHTGARSTVFSNEVFYGRELPTEHLLVCDPQSLDAPGLLKPLISPFVFLAIVAWTIDLDDEVKCRQVEIRDPVAGRVEPLLKTIGKAERSEVRAEQVLRGRCPLFSLSDENGVLLRGRKLGKRNTSHARHTWILTRATPIVEEKRTAFLIARISRAVRVLMRRVLQSCRDRFSVCVTKRGC